MNFDGKSINEMSRLFNKVEEAATAEQLKEQDRKLEETAQIVFEKMQEIKRLDAEIERLESINEVVNADSTDKAIPSKPKILSMYFIGFVFFYAGLIPCLCLPDEGMSEADRLIAFFFLIFLSAPSIVILVKAYCYERKRKRQRKW